MLRWLRRRAPQPPKNWAGPESFQWSDAVIAAMSKALRKHGQPDSPDWHVTARVCLNTLRGGSAVELVARAIEASHNPRHDPDRPITGGHYMHGMPHWCVWVEYARPAVEALALGFVKSLGIGLSPEEQAALNKIFETATAGKDKLDKAVK